MPISFLPVSDHRFKRSPFFACNDRDDTKYSIYNGRLYPISSGYDEKAHYLHLRSKCCLYDVPETPLRITGPDSLAFLQKLLPVIFRRYGLGEQVMRSHVIIRVA